MAHLLAVALGLGLAAAAGLRIFVPLLAAGLAGRFGLVDLSPGFTWLAATPALVILGTATVFEIAGYFVPWLDHTLDVIASPLAVLAGMAVTASVLVDMPPAIKWTLVIIGGGGIASVMQATTVTARLKSALVTGGVANPVVALAESTGAIAISILAVLVPALCLLSIVVAAAVLIARRRRAALRPSPQ